MIRDRRGLALVALTGQLAPFARAELHRGEGVTVTADETASTVYILGRGR